MFQVSSQKGEILCFRCWYSMKTRYVIFRAPKYFIGRCLFKFGSSHFVLIWIHSAFQILVWKIMLTCCSYSLLKRGTLNLLGAKISFNSFYLTSVQNLNFRSSHFVFIGARGIFKFLHEKVSLVSFFFFGWNSKKNWCVVLRGSKNVIEIFPFRCC